MKKFLCVRLMLFSLVIYLWIRRFWKEDLSMTWTKLYRCGCFRCCLYPGLGHHEFDQIWWIRLGQINLVHLVSQKTMKWTIQGLIGLGKELCEKKKNIHRKKYINFKVTWKWLKINYYLWNTFITEKQWLNDFKLDIYSNFQKTMK